MISSMLAPSSARSFAAVLRKPCVVYSLAPILVRIVLNPIQMDPSQNGVP
jgi:hypothetical protein